MRSNSSAFENSVIGDDTVVKENAIIKPNIKIWPNKMIDEGAEVNSNLVWGSKYTKAIFGNRGITGRINVDITPEYASKLGCSFGVMYQENNKIGVSCDGSNSSNMIKGSFISGLLSEGIEVHDFGKILLPITRSAIRFYGLDAGIYISSSINNMDRIFIDFLDNMGSNISRLTERKIENAFIREDYNRCEGKCIKEVKVIPDYSKIYLRNIINSKKSPNLKYKIGLSSNSKLIIDTMKNLLVELGCEVDTIDVGIIDSNEIRECNNSSYVRFFSNQIKMRSYDMGVFIEDTSEKMMLIDNHGKIITEDVFIALISLILFKTLKGGTVIVPISASQVIEKIAEQNNGKVVRTKTSSQEIMARILHEDIKEEMLEQFTMHFDAMAGLVKILDFMSTNNYMLADLVSMIPEIHIDKKRVDCPWNAKGKVIREIIQDKSNTKIETLEGVKVYNKSGWVLVLPDSEYPVCSVISESHSTEFAEELSNIYMNKIREISRT